MMKNFSLTNLLVPLTASVAILLTPKINLAQVNTSLLTEVVKSCQQDAFSPEYYERMGINLFKWRNNNDYTIPCVEARYYYSLVLSKLPWLSSTSEIFPGYRGDVATSLIAFIHGKNPSYSRELLDCLVNQDASSSECKLSAIGVLSRWHDVRNTEPTHTYSDYLVYTCPSCVVAYDDIGSTQRMTDAFLKWFLTLDKPKRREVVMTILGEKHISRNNHSEMRIEADEAVKTYIRIRQRVQQQEQEQRRREVLGE